MDEITFTSGNDRCSAWHLHAASDALDGARGRPCVVMAPGFGGTRDSGLLGYAQGFAAAGMHVLLFDYRGFGASGGSPRQLVSVQRQRRDYHAAVAAARRLPGVDPERIVLWGISYAGGHVVVAAAQDQRVAATISVTPAMDGIPVLIQLARNGGVSHLARATGNGLRDALRGLTGRAPHLVPMVGEPGSNAIIVKTGAEKAFAAIAGPTWQQRAVRAHRAGGGTQPADQGRVARALPAARPGRDQRQHLPAAVRPPRRREGGRPRRAARVPRRPRGRLRRRLAGAGPRRPARLPAPLPMTSGQLGLAYRSLLPEQSRRSAFPTRNRSHP